MFGKNKTDSDNIYLRIDFVLGLERLRSPECSSDFPRCLCSRSPGFGLIPSIRHMLFFFFEIPSYPFFIPASFITFGSFHHRAAEPPSQSDGFAPWKGGALRSTTCPLLHPTKGTKMETQVTLEQRWAN